MERERVTTAWQVLSSDEALDRLESSWEGLSTEEAQRRLKEYGPNRLARSTAVQPA